MVTSFFADILTPFSPHFYFLPLIWSIIDQFFILFVYQWTLLIHIEPIFFLCKYKNYLVTIAAISYCILKDVKNLLVFDLIINFDIFSPRGNISAMKKTLLTCLLFACFSRTILKSQPWDRFLLKINIQKM